MHKTPFRNRQLNHFLKEQIFYAFCYKKISSLFLFYVWREKITLHVQLSSVRGALTILIILLLDITNTRQKLINVPNTIIPIKEKISLGREQPPYLTEVKLLPQKYINIITLSLKYQKCVKLVYQNFKSYYHQETFCFSDVSISIKNCTRYVQSNDAFVIIYRCILRDVWACVEFIATPGHGFFFGSRSVYFGGKSMYGIFLLWLVNFFVSFLHFLSFGKNNVGAHMIMEILQAVLSVSSHRG
jgi:hypothetical protein